VSAVGGGKTGICPSLEVRTKNQNFLETWGQQFNSGCLNSCKDSLYAGMTLTLQKSQAHCSPVATGGLW